MLENWTFTQLRGPLRKVFLARKELTWVSAGQILSLAGGVASIKILTHLLGPKGYGELALGLTVAGFIGVLFGPLGQVLLRFYSHYFEKDQLPIFYKAFERLIVWTVILSLSMTLIAFSVSYFHIEHQIAFLIVAGSFTGILQGITGIIQTELVAKMLRQKLTLFQSFDAWFKIVFGVIAILVFHGKAIAVIFAYAVSASLLLIWRLRRSETFSDPSKIKKEQVQTALKDFWLYAKPFFLFGPAGVFGFYADRWVIQGLMGAKEVGVYAALMQITQTPANLVYAVFSIYLTPKIFKKAGNLDSKERVREAEKLTHKLIQGTAIVLLGEVIVCAVWGDLIIRILTTVQFREFDYLLWPIAIGVSLYCLSQAICIFSQIHKTTTLYFLCTIARSVYGIILCFLFGKKNGLSGVVWAYTFSNLLLVLSVVAVSTPRITSRVRTYEIINKN